MSTELMELKEEFLLCAVRGMQLGGGIELELDGERVVKMKASKKIKREIIKKSDQKTQTLHNLV